MKSLTIIFLTMTAILFSGCSVKNQLNTEWKKSISQLQITPVMPLKEELAIGEVIRYLKKPKSFSEDGQVEPGTAFTVNVKKEDIIKNKLAKWPSFKYDNSFNSNIGATIKSAAVLSSSFKKKNDLILTITDSYSNSIPIYKIKEELLDIDGDKYTLKTKYQTILNKLRYSWTFLGKKYKRKVLYLRIPTEVYYAKKIEVTAVSNLDSNVKVDIEKIKSNLTTLENTKDEKQPNIDITFVSNSTISLNETFEKPMVIGYRGILLEIYLDKNFEVNELPEDADLEFWSSL